MIHKDLLLGSFWHPSQSGPPSPEIEEDLADEELAHQGHPRPDAHVRAHQLSEPFPGQLTRACTPMHTTRMISLHAPCQALRSKRGPLPGTPFLETNAECIYNDQMQLNRAACLLSPERLDSGYKPDSLKLTVNPARKRRRLARE